MQSERNEAGAAASATANAGEQDYRAPPELLAVSGGGGRVALTGSASPNAEVRLASPDAAPVLAAADAQGRWTVSLPLSADARLFNLSMLDQGRQIQARGYLFLAPDGAAARLRAGGGTELLTPGVGFAPLALDYDNQHAVTLSGRAAPGEQVRVQVDGVERGQGTAAADGRFVLPFNQPLAAGPHSFELDGASAGARFDAPIGAPAPLARSPFAAARSAGGWRVDWLTPGGGEQVTLLFTGAAA